MRRFPTVYYIVASYFIFMLLLVLIDTLGAAPRPPELVGPFNEETHQARQRQPGRHHSVRGAGLAGERLAAVCRVKVRAGTDAVYSPY